MSGRVTFAIVAMMREDAAVVRRFMAHYTALGADEILLYVDGPVPPGLPTPPQVTVTECDDAFWERTCGGGRPHILKDAQGAVFAEARERAQSDWLWIADADEFLVPGRSVRAVLVEIPGGVEAVSVPPMEAVWGPGDDVESPFGCSHARLPLGRLTEALVMRPIYGGSAPLFRRAGLVAHDQGKHFVRRAAEGLRIDNHRSRRDGRGVTVPISRLGIVGLRLVHYDAISFPDGARSGVDAIQGRPLRPGSTSAAPARWTWPGPPPTTTRRRGRSSIDSTG